MVLGPNDVVNWDAPVYSISGWLPSQANDHAEFFERGVSRPPTGRAILVVSPARAAPSDVVCDDSPAAAPGRKCRGGEAEWQLSGSKTTPDMRVTAYCR